MVGEACLPSNAYYPRTPDFTLCSGVHVCWSEHSDSSFVYGFMILDYGFGTMTATTYRLKITISPIRLHSNPSLQIPRSTARFNSLLPTVNVSPLKLYSVSSITLYGVSSYTIFSNHLRIRLSPIKSPILQKYKNPYKRNSMYPNISKCNAKSCTCCNHLICQSTIIS